MRRALSGCIGPTGHSSLHDGGSVRSFFRWQFAIRREQRTRVVSKITSVSSCRINSLP